MLGPNGCGKTTSIGMMLGLIEPSEGEIKIDNKNLQSFKRSQILSRKILLLLYRITEKLTVKQNFKFTEDCMELKI